MPQEAPETHAPAAKRRRPIAEVVALIAIGISITTGGAVASHLVVTTSDLAKNAVDGSKVDNGSLSGKDVKEGSLAKVPSTAKVGKSSAKRFKKVTGVTGETLLASLGGLRLTYECVQSGISPVPQIDAKTSIDDAIVTWGLVRGPEGTSEQFWSYIYDLDRNEAQPLDDATASGSLRFTYRAAGSTISGSLDFSATGSQCIAQGVLLGA
jgi:hypothetical protein